MKNVINIYAFCRQFHQILFIFFPKTKIETLTLGPPGSAMPMKSPATMTNTMGSMNRIGSPGASNIGRF